MASKPLPLSEPDELGSDRRTPIIAITAGARPEDRQRCLAAGMDDCLTKPVRKDALLAAVGRAIESGDRFGTMDSDDRGGCFRAESACRPWPGELDANPMSPMAAETTGAVRDDGVVPILPVGITLDAPIDRPVQVDGLATDRHGPLPRVLVVDDDEVSQDVTVLMLEHLGVRADAAGSGVEALRALDHAAYDVVLIGHPDAGDGRTGGKPPDP